MFCSPQLSLTTPTVREVHSSQYFYFLKRCEKWKGFWVGERIEKRGLGDSIPWPAGVQMVWRVGGLNHCIITGQDSSTRRKYCFETYSNTTCTDHKDSSETFPPFHYASFSPSKSNNGILCFFMWTVSYCRCKFPRLYYLTSQVCCICNGSLSLCKHKQKLETLVTTETRLGTLLATCHKQSVTFLAAVTTTAIRRIILCYLPVTNNKTLKMKF